MKQFNWAANTRSLAVMIAAVGSVVMLYVPDRMVALTFGGFCWSVALVFAGESAADAGNAPAVIITSISVLYGIVSLILLLLRFPHNFFVRRAARGRRVVVFALDAPACEGC